MIEESSQGVISMDMRTRRSWHNWPGGQGGPWTFETLTIQASKRHWSIKHCKEISRMQPCLATRTEARINCSEVIGQYLHLFPNVVGVRSHLGAHPAVSTDTLECMILRVPKCSIPVAMEAFGQIEAYFGRQLVVVSYFRSPRPLDSGPGLLGYSFLPGSRTNTNGLWQMLLP